MANTNNDDNCNDIEHFDVPTYPSDGGRQLCNNCNKPIASDSPRFGCQ